MAQGIAVLEQELPKYIQDVRSKHSENAKAFAFSSLIQKVFGIQTEDLDLEVPVQTALLKLHGRVDAVFGNLIIEFKKDLRTGIEDAEKELMKYLQAYHEKYPDARYLGMANDGINFRVYQPIFQTGIVTKLELIDKIDLRERERERETLKISFFGSILIYSHLRRLSQLQRI